ncbi:hypothetical protein QCA50_020634 [Cerrena zonata]|uniref:FAD-binding domain-containing protein n=1 Tax=Cerrena zonata TaxID=2478898 RepID=A0AAW0F966_9APHY
MASTHHNDVLRIAICGGGIGGLSLALALKTFSRNKKLLVDLYEADPSFTEIGAGINLWHRSRYILDQLGIDDSLKTRSFSPPMKVRRSNTPDGILYYESQTPGDVASVTLHRREMLSLLVEGLGFGTEPDSFIATHFSKRLTGYDQDSSGVTLHFQDGSTAHAHVLVGADGISSATRKAMYSQLAEHAQMTDPDRADSLMTNGTPIWAGIHIYRFLIDAAKIRAVEPNHASLLQSIVWGGEGIHVVTYPISPTIINAAMCVDIPGGFGTLLSEHTKVPVAKEEITQLTEGWEEDLQILIKNSGDIVRWSVSQVQPLPQFVDGRVALLGDSAHAMVPFAGAGAGQAIEDAYILGLLLSQPSVNTSNIADVLNIYDTIRKPFSQDVANRSTRMGKFFQLHPDHLPPHVDFEKTRQGDRAELEKLGNAIDDLWSFHYTEMPSEDWKRAKSMLDEMLQADGGR